jgi:hypothetical protein
MDNFNLRKYLAENKLVKENITLDAALIKFEKDESDSSAQPSIEGISEIRNFIDFLRERKYKETELDKAFDEYTDEITPPSNTHTDIQNFIDYYRKEKNKVELEEIDMTISSEAVESSVKQGLNQMFERLADIVDNKKEASIQSETLGVTNYIKRLMREYAKYADMDRQDSIEGGNKFSKQGKEEARQEIERILSMK